jgi:hypothetical protein
MPMTERGRVLLQAAFVSAVVGGTAAAIVTTCGGHDEEAREREQLPSAPTLTSAGMPPPADVPRAAEPLPPPRADIPDADAPGMAPPPAPTAELPMRPEPDAAVEVAETLDAGAPVLEDGGAMTAAEREEEDAGVDAGSPYEALFRGPSFSAGAGEFLTEPPRWGASAWTPNPDAGAGTFLTTPDPWAASAMTPNPEAGAGPFTTERNTPGDYLFLPPFFFIPAPPPSEAAEPSP